MATIYDDLTAGETPVQLNKLPRESCMPHPGGRELDRGVGYRWHLKGKDGHRLEAIKTPTGLSTTRSAVLRFFAALTDPDTASKPLARTPARRQRDIAAAERELAAAGIA